MAHGEIVNRNLVQGKLGFFGINNMVRNLQTDRCSCKWFRWKITAFGSALFHTITTIALGVIALVANLVCLCGSSPRTINRMFNKSASSAEFAIRHLFGCIN